MPPRTMPRGFMQWPRPPPRPVSASAVARDPVYFGGVAFRRRRISAACAPRHNRDTINKTRKTILLQNRHLPKNFSNNFSRPREKTIQDSWARSFSEHASVELMISKKGCCEFTKRCVIVRVIGQIDSESPPRPGTSQRRKQRRRQGRSLAAPAAEG